MSVKPLCYAKNYACKIIDKLICRILDGKQKERQIHKCVSFTTKEQFKAFCGSVWCELVQGKVSL